MRHASPVRQKIRLPIRIVLVLTVALLLLSHTTRAATIVVDETTCTLIDAILAANTDLAAGGCPAGSGFDAIELTTDVELTAAHVSPPGVGDLGLPVLTGGIVLRGAGHTIRRDPDAPEFGLMMMLSSVGLKLQDVTLSNGASGFRGGAILIAEGTTLYLERVTIADNSSLDGGGIGNHGELRMEQTIVSGNTAKFDGGGIWNEGEIRMETSELSDNSAERHGGGIFNGCGEIDVENSTVSSNTAAFYGGGIDGSTCSGYASVELRWTTVASNSAGSLGGGLYFRDGSWRLDYILAGHNGAAGNCARGPAPTVFGYGISFDDDGTCYADYAPELGFLTGLDPILADNGGPTRTHALLADSSAVDATESAACPDMDQRGEPRESQECDIGAYELQPEPIVVDEVNCSLVDAFVAVDTGNPTNGCIPPRGRATVILTTDVTLTEPYDNIIGWVGVPSPANYVIVQGGQHTIARAANAPPFRFITVEPNQSLSLKEVTLTNFSVAGGDSQAGHGGAILNLGSLVLDRASLSRNSAVFGGAIANDVYAYASLISSTVSDNSVSMEGGGFYTNGGTLTLTNSTVSGNSAANGFGGIVSRLWGPVTLKNSTVAGNSSGGVRSFHRAASFENTVLAHNGPAGNCADLITDLGDNFADDFTCGPGFGFMLDLDRTLSDNGGPTLTHALLPGSSAIDAAGNCGLETDQRGMPRNDDTCDGGAYEFQCSIELYSADDLTWIAFTPEQSAFDIVTGNLADLLVDGDFGDALCMGSYPASPAMDLLADPDPGEGRYFLARGLVSCTGAGHGNSSLSPDPRDVLDSGPCPGVSALRTWW